MKTVVSQRVEALIEDLKRDPQAGQKFKSLILKEGTPLVEEVEHYQRFVWATHFYFTSQSLENVAVYEDHIDFNWERAKMDHIPGTDIWYKTTIVPYGHKLNYAFSLNDSLEATCDKRMTNLITDPNNQKTIKKEALTLSTHTILSKP